MASLTNDPADRRSKFLKSSMSNFFIKRATNKEDRCTNTDDFSSRTSKFSFRKSVTNLLGIHHPSTETGTNNAPSSEAAEVREDQIYFASLQPEEQLIIKNLVVAVLLEDKGYTDFAAINSYDHILLQHSGVTLTTINNNRTRSHLLQLLAGRFSFLVPIPTEAKDFVHLQKVGEKG